MIVVIKNVIQFIIKNWKYALILFVLGLGYYNYSLKQINSNLKDEISIKDSNIKTLNSEVDEFKIKLKSNLKSINGKDSIITLNAAKIWSLTYSIEEYRRYRNSDLATIASLNLKLRDIQNITYINTLTNTVIKSAYIYKDSVRFLDYQDKWITIKGKLNSDEVSIETRDSLIAVVSNVPKHKLLWWSWGTKGVELNITSANPNTKFTYLKYIEIKK